MVVATLSRGSTSVEIPLLAGPNSLLVGVDHGKPNLQIQETGTIDPRHIDEWSGLESYTILGRFEGSNAYDDVITLADLIKSHSRGTPLTLDIPLPEFDDHPITVAPAAGQEEALSMAYPPGRRNSVEIDLGLTRVAETLGGPAGGSSLGVSKTPTASGSGPVELQYGDATVTLSRNIDVSRAVGRPASTVRRRPDTDHPTHIDKYKTAYDGFDITLETGTLSKITDIVSMFRTQLGRGSFTLDFNGIYGMGAFDVVPQGSAAFRHTRQSSEQGTKLIPTLKLRRVLSR